MTTDGHVACQAGIQARLKCMSHALSCISYIGDSGKVEGSRDSHAPFHPLLVHRLFRLQNFVYFYRLFWRLLFFDGLGHLFDSFPTTLWRK
jgi:hypothetical protein